MDRPQERRKRRIRAGEKAEAKSVQALELGAGIERGPESGEAGAARLSHEMCVGRSGERGQRELAHAATSFGER